MDSLHASTALDPASGPAMATAMEMMGLPGQDLPGQPRRLRLPGGWAGPDGQWQQLLDLGELSGADEEALFNRPGGDDAAQVSLLLSRLAVPAGTDPQAWRPGFAHALQPGDHHYLLLRLRQLDLGDAVHQVQRCRHCSAKVDVDFLISELPLRRGAGLQQAATPLQVPDGRLSLRLPTAADQQAVAHLAADDPALANTRLFCRLVLDADGQGPPGEDQVRQWSSARRLALVAWLQAQSTGPDLYLDLTCPHCSADMGDVFDLPRFFLAERLGALDQLYQEVHVLALHYHWAEAQILALSSTKRWRYLGLLAQQLGNAETVP